MKNTENRLACYTCGGRSRRRGATGTLSLAVAIALSSVGCSQLFYNKLNNPVDPQASNYQGYETTNDPDAVKPATTSSELTFGAFTVSNVVGADAYRLQIATGSAFEDLVYSGDSFTSNTMAPSVDLTAGTTYYWRAAVHKSGSWGSWTDGEAFTMTAIAGLSPGDGTSSSITLPTLSWDAVNGADHYEIQIAGTQAGVATSTAVTSSTNSYMPATALANNQTYYWRVRAIDANGQCGGWSDILSLLIRTVFTSWTKATGNPIIDIGASGAFDGLHVVSPIVLHVAGGYRMYYLGIRGSYDEHVGMATSANGSTWTKATPNPVFGADGEYATVRGLGSVIQDAEGYKMYYIRYPAVGTGQYVFLATSSDGLDWKEYSGSQSHGSVLLPSVGSPAMYEYNIARPFVIYDSDESVYKMWYSQSIRTGSSDPNGYRIDYATSSDGRNWTKYASNPVLSPGAAGDWDEHSVGVSSVIKVSANEYRMFYYSNNHIGLALSTDGINWTKSPDNPILAPGSAGSWDSARVSDGYVTQIGTLYRMYYVGGDGGSYRIGYADLAQ